MSEEKIKADIKRMGELYIKALDGGKFNADSTIQFNAELTGKSMSERPAPETACASFLVSQGDPDEWAVPLEVAENIERALGEAMEKYFAMRELSNNATELAEKYKRERDEARELNAKLRNIAETAINYLDQSYRDGFADEVSDLRYELEQLKEAAK